jgi:hypothetical protein
VPIVSGALVALNPATVPSSRSSAFDFDGSNTIA